MKAKLEKKMDNYLNNRLDKDVDALAFALAYQYSRGYNVCKNKVFHDKTVEQIKEEACAWAKDENNKAWFVKDARKLLD